MKKEFQDYYISQKFRDAVEILARPDPIKKRLYDACLGLHVLAYREPQHEMQASIDQLWYELTEKEAIADEGTLKATIDGLSENEAYDYAVKIIRIYEIIVRREGSISM